ncbi:MAG: hypothetical protein H0W64_10935 [Gammaproteobacteria bacterium]|nr:hypothetical protein [Gammaproteobacteria bacterium]
MSVAGWWPEVELSRDEKEVEPRVVAMWTATILTAPVSIPVLAICAATHSYLKDQEDEKDRLARHSGFGFPIQRSHGHGFFHKYFVHNDQMRHTSCPKCHY